MLLVYNRSATDITLTGTSIVVPQSPAPPSRGPGVNVTSELKGLTGPEYTALEAQRAANNLSYEWSGSPEFSTGTLVTQAPVLEEVIEGDTYDYIIVGAGTAGAPLAKMLTDDLTTSVLVIESGVNENTNPDILNPESTQNFARYVRTSAAAIHSQTDGRVYSEGNAWGGGSAVNYQQAVRLTPEVAADWATVDAQWDYPALLPLMKYMETFTPGAGVPNNAAERGAAGPLSIESGEALNGANAFNVAAAAAMNVTIVQDHNDKTLADVGLSPYQGFFSGGFAQRSFAGTAFLGPTVVDPNTGLGVSGRKLTIVHGKCDKAIMEFTGSGPEAKGVRYLTQKDGRSVMVDVFASTKVILCAGAYHDAAILQRSGVGDATLLGDLDIPIYKANSNVGAHMHSHAGPYAYLPAAANPGDWIDASFPPVFFSDLSGANGLGAADGVRRVQGTFILSPFFFVLPVEEQLAYGIFPFAQMGVIGLSFNMEPARDGTVAINERNPMKDLAVNFNMYDGPGGAAYMAAQVKILKMFANVSLATTDSFPLYPPASAYPDSFATTGGVHDADDATNTLAAAVPTDLATSQTALNEIKAAFNAHLTQAGVHGADDLSGGIVSADATDQPTAEVLANEIKARLAAHLASGDYHVVSDQYNGVEAPAAVDLTTLVDLTAELQTKYTGHLTQKKQVGGQESGANEDDVLVQMVNNNYILTFHACGTARMSADDTTGVVDGNLDVHGVGKLAVCSNASVKSTPKGNNSYIAYVMGLQKAKIEGATTPY